MSKQSSNSHIEDVVLDRVYDILEHPRVNAYTPQALVEIVCALLSLCFDKRKFEKKMFLEYGGNRPWWLSEDLDYPTAVKRLRKITSYLESSGGKT